MKKNSIVPIYETLFLLLGELAVSAITVGVFALLGKFSYKVITGAALGSLIVIINFVILSIQVNLAIDRAMNERPEGELDDEAAATFAAEHEARIRNAAKLSYIVRSVSMLAALVIAFVLDWFDVIATLVPFLAMRPIITVEEIFRKKANK
ncbi:MAG: hypothetical protein IJY65_00285 [Clostridia bacterium]|nr:hypothetical protein [Clostridia bacterium]